MPLYIVGVKLANKAGIQQRKKKLEESKAQNNLVNKTLCQEQGFTNLQG